MRIALRLAKLLVVLAASPALAGPCCTCASNFNIVIDESVTYAGTSPHALVRMKSTSSNNDYLFACMLSSPTQLVRYDPFHLATAPTVLTYASDTHHDQCTQLRYRAANNRLYASFTDGSQVTIAEINPDTMASTDVITDAAGVALQFGSIALSPSYIYAITNQNPSEIIRYNNSTFVRIDKVTLTGKGSGHAIEADQSTDLVIASGSTGGTVAWVARAIVSAGTLTLSEAVILPSNFISPTDDIAIDPNNVYMGFENAGTKQIAIIQRSSLTNVKQALTTGYTPVYGMFFRSPFVYATIGVTPGRLGRLDVNNLGRGMPTCLASADKPNEYEEDSTYGYYSTFNVPTTIARFLK